MFFLFMVFIEDNVLFINEKEYKLENDIFYNIRYRLFIVTLFEDLISISAQFLNCSFQ